jgi:hypothetical protein
MPATEFDDDTDDEVFDGEPEIESAEEYGYEEPSTDVPAPDDVEDQNPGYIVDEGGAA